MSKKVVSLNHRGQRVMKHHKPGDPIDPNAIPSIRFKGFIEEMDWSREEVSRILGVDLSTLWRNLEKYEYLDPIWSLAYEALVNRYRPKPEPIQMELPIDKAA